jgi:predicted lactoylglutathione lyase
MPRVIFVNLRAKDEDRSGACSAHPVYSFHPRFTNATAAGLVVSERSHAVLPTRDTFRPLTARATCDAT